jgi:hypothetical protein
MSNNRIKTQADNSAYTERYALKMRYAFKQFAFFNAKLVKNYFLIDKSRYANKL